MLGPRPGARRAGGCGWRRFAERSVGSSDSPTRSTRGQWGDGSQAANTHIAGVKISTILQDLNR